MFRAGRVFFVFRIVFIRPSDRVERIPNSATVEFFDRMEAIREPFDPVEG